MKKYISIIIILIIALLVLTGCTSENTSIADNSRFVKISDERCFSIYYDSKTKVEYAVSDGYYNSGTVTVLLNANGRPLLYEGE